MNFQAFIISLLVFASAKSEAPTWATCAHAERVFSAGALKWKCENEGKKLGSGSTGVAYLLKNANGEKAVCKIMDFQDPFEMAKAKTEYDVLKAVTGQKNIIKFIDGKVVTINPKGKVLMILQEFAENGTLEDFHQKNPALFSDPRFTMKIVAGILNGVKNMHLFNYVHADLKLGNVVIDGQQNPKLIDFDLANVLDAEGDFKGSPAYADPRILFNKLKVYDGKVDIYSLGVMMYKLITNNLPFVGLTVDGVKRVINVGNIRIPNRTDRTLAIIMAKCLQRDASKRPSVDELVKMIDDYLKSGTDIYVKELMVSNSQVPTEAQFEVLWTNSIAPKTAAQSQRGTRRPRNLLNGKQETGDKKTGDNQDNFGDKLFVGLLWVAVAFLMFLGCRVVIRSFEKLRMEAKDVKEDTSANTVSLDSTAPQDPFMVVVHAS